MGRHSHETVSVNHNFWRERWAEAESNWVPSAYQPNALPLGQNSSHIFLLLLLLLLLLYFCFSTATSSSFFFLSSFFLLSRSFVLFFRPEVILFGWQDGEIQLPTSSPSAAASPRIKHGPQGAGLVQQEGCFKQVVSHFKMAALTFENSLRHNWRTL